MGVSIKSIQLVFEVAGKDYRSPWLGSVTKESFPSVKKLKLPKNLMKTKNFTIRLRATDEDVRGFFINFGA